LHWLFWVYSGIKMKKCGKSGSDCKE